jgi:acyl carrier protein
MWSEESIKQSVRNFLSRFIRNPYSDGDDIFKLGLVNSLIALQLVSFVETTFPPVMIENEDLDLNNFRSIDNITSFVQRKLSS